MTINNVFVILKDAEAKSPTELARFLARYEMQLYPLLHPYGYKGSRVNDEATLKDFDAAYDTWFNGLKSDTMPRAGRPKPLSEAELRRRMWETAAQDPIAAAVIVLGAITAATLGRVFGFEQDPRKAAASAQTISKVVDAVGSLNNPHEVNEMVRQAEVPQDRIKEVSGPNVRNGSPAYGTRYPNTGAPGVNKQNCGQSVGAVLEGMGGTSTSFAGRALHPEGWTYSPLSLAHQFQIAGNFTGPIKQASTPLELIKQLQAFPPGTNVAVLYTNPGGKDGHVICALIGKNREVLFVDAQMSPPQVVVGPVPGATDFHYFAVTPKPR